MTRSLKKGPFVDHHLLAKVEKAVATKATSVKVVKAGMVFSVGVFCGATMAWHGRSFEMTEHGPL